MYTGYSLIFARWTIITYIYLWTAQARNMAHPVTIYPAAKLSCLFLSTRAWLVDPTRAAVPSATSSAWAASCSWSTWSSSTRTPTRPESQVRSSVCHQNLGWHCFFLGKFVSTFKWLPKNELIPLLLFLIMIVDIMHGSGVMSIDLGIESFLP